MATKLRLILQTMSQIRVGISGWRNPPWRGKFYPRGLPQRLELSYATPADFVFSVKGSRFITHMQRLKNVEQAQASFWASGILRLREKLGPILWQFPPNFEFDGGRASAVSAVYDRAKR